MGSPGAHAINSQASRAGFANAEDFFRHLEQARIRALLAPDMALLWQLHAPHYQLITPSGTTFTRERYLAMIETGQLRYAQWQAQAMQVRVSDPMAIVRYRATLGFATGTDIECWHTDSYELLAGGWQAVWSQATAVRAA